MIALAAARFKAINKLVYGFVEVVVALFAAWEILGSLKAERFQNIATLVGAVYFISRGLSNMYEDIESRRKQHNETLLARQRQ